MEKNEMIKIIMDKAKVTEDEARSVLEECNWDLADTIIHLERNGKIENNDVITVTEVKEEEKDKKNKKNNKENYGGIGSIVGRMFKFIGRIIKRGNENYFEINKENENPIRISLTISILLTIVLTVPVIVLLIVGLFCGYRYSLSGSKMKYDGVNSVFEKASKSADTIKRDFSEGYNE